MIIDFFYIIKLLTSTYIILSFMEWILHNKIMHGNEKQLRKIPIIGNYLGNTAKLHLEHHKEVKSDMTLHGISNVNSLFFSWKLLFTMGPVYYIILYLIMNPENKLFFLIYVIFIVLLEGFIWNNFHNDMHNSDFTIDLFEGFPNSPKKYSKGFIYRWLWKNHAIHHLQKYNKGNFNIIYPGFDLFFNTYNNKIDNRDFCKDNPNDKRVCGQYKQKVLSDDDILPKQ